MSAGKVSLFAPVMSAMPAIHKLTHRAALSLSRPGLHSDGDGLYLQVTPKGSRSWIFRTRQGDKIRSVGLGPFPAISLASAREKAALCRSHRAEGLDPLIEKRKAAAAEAAKRQTFRTVAREYVATHKAAWRNPKTLYIWEHSLSAYAFPVFGDLPVADIDRNHVQAALAPIWGSKAETARRLRRHVEAVLDYAARRVIGLATTPPHGAAVYGFCYLQRSIRNP